MNKTVKITMVSSDYFLFEAKDSDVNEILNGLEQSDLINIQINGSVTTDTWITPKNIESIEITKESKTEYIKRMINNGLVYVDQDNQNY